MIAWPPEKVTHLRDELEKSRKYGEQIASEYDWQGNLDRYVPPVTRNQQGAIVWEVNVGADFRNVERKKAALFHDTPAVSFVPPSPDRPVLGPDGQPAQLPTGQPLMLSTLVTWHSEFANKMLGPQHANVKPTILKSVFDCLCPAGIGPVKVGFEARTVSVDAPVLDPMTQQPVINPVTLQPQTEPKDVPIFERWFVSRLSPKALRLPADFRDTDYTQSPWIAYDFERPLSQIRREYRLPSDFRPTGGGGTETPKPYFTSDEALSRDPDDPMVRGTYLEYRAEVFAESDQPVHPQQIHYLVLIEGIDQPVIHVPCPHQQIGPDARLTPDSITTFTINPLVLRDLSDHQYVPSDCTVTSALTVELNKFRTVTVKQRDAQRQLVLFDTAAFPPEVRDKMERGTIGQFVGLEQGAMAGGIDGIMKQVTTVQQGRESYLGQDYIERDLEKTLGIGDNQAGAQTTTKRTATESANVQRNSEARFEQERQRVLDWYVSIVRIFDTLLIRHGDARTASLILGPERGALWAQHKHMLAGGYSYEIATNSGKYIDISAERKYWADLYNMTAQDPNVRRTATLKHLANAAGIDPSDWIIETLPEKGPEPPKVSITISADNFNPQLPQFPIVIEVARLGGWKISEEAIKLAQTQAAQAGQLLAGVPIPVSGASPDPKAPTQPPPHGGAQPHGALVNQHTQDRTGERSGPQVM